MYTRPALAQPAPQAIDPNRLLALVAEVAREARPHVDTYVALDSSLERDLGLDSLARVELVLRLEREFAASLPEPQHSIDFPGLHRTTQREDWNRLEKRR